MNPPENGWVNYDKKLLQAKYKAQLLELGRATDAGKEITKKIEAGNRFTFEGNISLEFPLRRDFLQQICRVSGRN